MTSLIRGPRGIVALAHVNCQVGGSVKGYGFELPSNPARTFVHELAGVVSCYSPWLKDPNTRIFVTPFVTPDGAGNPAYCRVNLLDFVFPDAGNAQVELYNSAGALTDGPFSIMLVNLGQNDGAVDYTVVA